MTIRKALTGVVIGAAFLAVSVVPTASAQARVFMRPYYSYYPHYHYYGGFYGPRWYYPGQFAYVPPSPPMGEVKIETHMKGGSIYVDGGFAGQTNKLKKFELRPGNHDIEVRDAAGATVYHDRVQVLVGKTTDIKLAG